MWLNKVFRQSQPRANEVSGFSAKCKWRISVSHILHCFADRCGSLSVNLCRFWVPPFPPSGLRVQVSILWSGMYDFPLNSFQCDGACWLAAAWVVPAHRVVRDTSMLCLDCVRPPANTLGTNSQAHLLVMTLITENGVYLSVRT